MDLAQLIEHLSSQIEELNEKAEKEGLSEEETTKKAELEAKKIEAEKTAEKDDDDEVEALRAELSERKRRDAARKLAEEIVAKKKEEDERESEAMTELVREEVAKMLGGNDLAGVVESVLKATRGGSRWLGDGAAEELVDHVAKGGEVTTVDKPNITVSGDRAKAEAKDILESKSMGRYMGILARAQRGEMYLSDGEKEFMSQQLQRKAAQIPLAEMTDIAGGFLVPQEWMDDILGLLRASAVVRLAGPRIIPFNKQMNQTSIVTGATAGYTAESSRITPAGMEFGEAVLLTPKNLTALVPISNYLLADAAGADAIVRQELVTIIALAEDFNFLRGDGSGGAPIGLLNISNITEDPITPASNGFEPSIADLRMIRAQFRNLNAGAVRLAWFFHSAFLAYLETLTDSDGRFLLDSALLQLNGDGISGTLDGTPFYLSNQIPINLTQGSSTNATDLTLVNMDELIVGMNQDLELAVSSEAAWSSDGSTWNSAFQQNQTLFRAVIRHDINHRRPNQVMVQHGVLV